MPEGDTIHRTAQVLQLALAGQRVARFETALAQLAEVDRDAPVAGRTVESVEARGKHLLISLSGDLVLRTHMRMSGSWHLYRPSERWRRPRAAMRVVLHTEPFSAVGFDVPVAELVTRAALERRGPVRLLGPDLLGAWFDAGEAARRLRERPERAVGEALLDQRALAGIGNVFESEILFEAGVHPERRVGSLTDAELAELLRLAERQLRANVPVLGARWGYAGQRRTTRSMNPREALFVYGRAGVPCRRCGTAIVLSRQGLGARLTYHCPRCQPAPASPVD